MAPEDARGGPPGREGFTLLEVVIALAILSGVVITVMTTLKHHLDLSEMTADSIIASLLAREKMEELALSAGVAAEGDFAPRFPDFNWRLSAEAVLPGIRKMELSVRRGEGPSVTIERYAASSMPEGRVLGVNGGAGTPLTPE